MGITIKIDPKDMEKTTFITLGGTFYCKVMPFGLKNDRVTYQIAMVTLLHDMMYKEDHIIDLQKLFKRLRKSQL